MEGTSAWIAQWGPIRILLSTERPCARTAQVLKWVLYFKKIYLKLQTHLDKYLSQRVSDFNTSLVSCKKTSSWEVQPMEQVLLLLQNAVSGSLIFFFVFLPLACVVFGNVITRRHFSWIVNWPLAYIISFMKNKFEHACAIVVYVGCMYDLVISVRVS